MNREQRRNFKKKMGKKLAGTADKIIEWHKLYEGKDDAKLERLITEEIKSLEFDQLMVLTEYIESSISDANS